MHCACKDTYVDVVSGRGANNVELGDGDFRDTGSGEGVEGSSSIGTLASLKMGLGSDTIDGNALRKPLLDVWNHTVGKLAVAC